MCKNEFKNIQKWFTYFPNKINVYSYSCNQIMSLEKIKDVYHSLSYSRLCLKNLFETNCGRIGDDNETELDRALVKSIIMNSCLSYCNYCIDYSWQVLWLYYSDVDESNFNNMDNYMELMENCKLRNLNILLKAKNEKDLKKHINVFFNKTEISKIRTKYNRIKHRGFYHIENLGNNYKQLPIIINGKRLPLLHREEINLNDLKQELVDFDNLFVEYFEVIIDKVVPSEIKNGKEKKLSLVEVIKDISKKL